MGTCFVVRDQRMILRGLVGFVLFDVGWSPEVSPRLCNRLISCKKNVHRKKFKRLTRGKP